MTVITNPLGVEHGLKYVITLGGLRAVLNDPTDADYVGFVNPRDGGGISGLERAGVRENADTLPEADGGVHGVFRKDRLPFTIGGIIPPDTPAGADTWLGRQAKLLAVTDAMSSDAVLAWTPSEAPAVQIGFRQQQPTRITGTRPKTFLVAGVAEDPLIYSQALNSVVLNPAAGVGGFTSPLRSLLTSSATAAGAITATNAGRSATWPVFTLAGPITNPVITGPTGAKLAFIYTLATGETLVIDTNPRRRSILLNGTGNRYGALDWTQSTWFALAPGANVINLGAAVFSAGASLTITWRDAWG